MHFENLDRQLGKLLSLNRPSGDGGNSCQIGQNRPDAFTPTVSQYPGKQWLHLVQASVRNVSYRVLLQLFADAIPRRFKQTLAGTERCKRSGTQHECAEYDIDCETHYFLHDCFWTSGANDRRSFIRPSGTYPAP